MATDALKPYRLLRVIPSNLQECENQMNELARLGYRVKTSEQTPIGMLVVMELSAPPLIELGDVAEPPAEASQTLEAQGAAADAPEPVYTVNGRKSKAKPQGKYKRG